MSQARANTCWALGVVLAFITGAAWGALISHPIRQLRADIELDWPAGGSIAAVTSAGLIPLLSLSRSVLHYQSSGWMTGSSSAWSNWPASAGGSATGDCTFWSSARASRPTTNGSTGCIAKLAWPCANGASVASSVPKPAPKPVT